ncbi:MAG: type II toxin-antitoxin system HicB family antitoxin [Gammaproteobacteria bacterium]|nr:type II toxin-antitoxin system HicB family antitoxin [Gammaproteobacteria bacterium]
MIKKEFDGFSVNIFLDDDNDWMAHFIELPSISACGDTAEEALAELKVAWEAAKESYKKHGEKIPVAPSQKKYSGHFNVRVDKRLHKQLAMEAAMAGISLNALIVQRLLKNSFDYGV